MRWGDEMKGLLEVKFDKFKDDFNLPTGMDERNWKRFVNYHFFSQFQPGRFDTDGDLLDQVCVHSMDYPMLQGALVLLNGQIISCAQDIDDILQKGRKGVFELYFLTTGEEGAFLKQIESLFQSLDMEGEKEPWATVIEHVMSKEITLKWEHAPELNLVYCFDLLEKDVRTEMRKGFGSVFITDFFSKVNEIPLGRQRLQDIINSNENSYKVAVKYVTDMTIKGSDKIKNKVHNAYVVSMEAQELLRLITTPDGLIRINMFDDNVRDFQGRTVVNSEIEATLREQPELFALFNNGITIVCDKVSQENGEYVLENPQIVNGCQTCNAIYRASQKKISVNDVQVIVKIVGSDEEDVAQGIVRGSNRQNIVYEAAFETIGKFHKNLEKYFEVTQIDGFGKIYYERRSRQYANNIQIKPQQKIGFRGLIQSMVALFLNHVENSHRHEYKLLQDYKDSLFIDTHSCSPYYLAAMLYLQVDMLFREGCLPKELSSYKLHVVLLIKEMKGGISPELSSKEIDGYCDRVFQAVKEAGILQSAKEACKKFQDIREKWVLQKGQEYKYGVKDSAEFRNFLMKEIHGVVEEPSVEKQYTGYVVNVKLDKNNTLYGFIEHSPHNIFFHEFDNPDMDRSYIDKKVTYKLISDGQSERAINVQVVDV